VLDSANLYRQTVDDLNRQTIELEQLAINANFENKRLAQDID